MIWKRSQFNAKLAEAVGSFDLEGAMALCESLIVHLRERDDPYPSADAKTVLTQLRKQRYFDLMESVADALIQNGQREPTVRRLYAQSQLDKGNLTAAISTLEALERDTAEEGGTPHGGEYAEARGLLGRAYKDLYVLANNPKLSRNRHFLAKSLEYYQDIYNKDKSKIWQGINSVALIRRAESDGVELNEIADLKLMADSIASEILAEVNRRHLDQQADTWDCATGLEACIGLGKHEETLKWLQRYLKSQYTNAFELGSTHRQLTQIWQLRPDQPPGDEVLSILRAELLKQKGSELSIGIEEGLLHSKPDEFASDKGFEKVLGTEGFKSLQWFYNCMSRAGAVARVEDLNSKPVGTAFVVRGSDFKPELGDELLFLTNAHVISLNPSLSDALLPRQALLTFESDKKNNTSKFKVDKVLWSSPPDQLDAVLLRPDRPIQNVDPIPVAPSLPLRDGEQRAYIIGHPRGRQLSFSIYDNYLLDYDDRFLHYRSPTEPGNSGSPVLNDDWEVIGLHHRGLKRMPRLNGQEGTYPANEGIWIQAIIKKLAEAS